MTLSRSDIDDCTCLVCCSLYVGIRRGSGCQQRHKLTPELPFSADLSRARLPVCTMSMAISLVFLVRTCTTALQPLSACGVSPVQQSNSQTKVDGVAVYIAHIGLGDSDPLQESNMLQAQPADMMQATPREPRLAWHAVILRVGGDICPVWHTCKTGRCRYCVFVSIHIHLHHHFGFPPSTNCRTTRRQYDSAPVSLASSSFLPTDRTAWR